MTFAVRLFAAEDALVLHRLHRRIFQPAPLETGYWNAARERPPALCVLVFQDGLTVAYCDGYVAGGEGDIVSIGTAPEARGQGAGGLALEAFIEAAGARGAERLTLEVAEENHAAQRLYRRYGFAEVGRRRGYYTDGGDALVFSLTGELAAADGRD